MKSIATTVALAALSLIFLSVVIAADGDPTPAKGTLPTHWRKLGLSDAQVKQTYAIQAKYHAIISDLEAKLKASRDEERSKLQAVLTEDQKKALRAIILKEQPEAPK
jgi:Spy/CpxP family protein refolding chaperone